MLIYQRILFFFFVSEAMAAETCCKVKEQERMRSFCLAEIRCVFSLRRGREIAERCEAILFGQLVMYSQDRGSFFIESQDKRVRYFPSFPCKRIVGFREKILVRIFMPLHESHSCKSKESSLRPQRDQHGIIT